jgi:hypothetical protein
MGLLWELLEGSQEELSGVSKELSVLYELETYREAAYAFVTSTMLALKQMNTEMEELRVSVAVPGAASKGREGATADSNRDRPERCGGTKDGKGENPEEEARLPRWDCRPAQERELDRGMSSKPTISKLPDCS